MTANINHIDFQALSLFYNKLTLHTHTHTSCPVLLISYHRQCSIAGQLWTERWRWGECAVETLQYTYLRAERETAFTTATSMICYQLYCACQNDPANVRSAQSWNKVLGMKIQVENAFVFSI